VANIYAPNPNTSIKIDFYEKLFETVLEFEEQFNCTNSLVLGDFNLNFASNEMKNRHFTVQEKGVANAVSTLSEELGFCDAWGTTPHFTWKRSNTDIFSTIDRILFKECFLKKVSIDTNWAMSKSDHAAVVASFEKTNLNLPCRDRITRLDPSLARHPIYGPQIVEEFGTMFGESPGHWNPHMRLEFAKLCIRTVVERIQADRKKKEVTEEELLDKELNIAIDQLSKTGPIGNLATYVEELRDQKSKLIEEKGERLAEKLGTKWYNEGEKSTKYFLRLLNRQMPDSITILKNDQGLEIKDPKEIEQEIVSFYKRLYESFEDITVNNDQAFFDQIDPISDDHDVELARPLTEEELRTTLHEVKDSAPGPDGIPYSIIGLLWPTFGKVLCDAWNYSLQIKELPISHRTSYLKLIPKASKDLTALTNWRPISLSNCDHKIITKTYAKRLCEKVSKKIGENQTAYIKGRIINDNIRSMLATINLASIDAAIDGLLVSLDAKKAFDSVSHQYIEECLRKFGCNHFIAIFRLLYKDLSTDILINGRIVKGFMVKRGVKQGDALSCILFIMCMEPLLRNIEINPNIAPIHSAMLNCTLPKTYGYADDISPMTASDEGTLNAIFEEYERLSKLSGLVLNAEKTELMRIGGNNRKRRYSVKYLSKNISLETVKKVKINGIIFQNNPESIVETNVEAIMGKIERHLKSWSRRSLSTLGKILICKTFGISQVIYLMQSIRIQECHIKRINALLFKFIWNRHFQAAKAPERIKREIMFTPIKKGGYGMLDIAELDKSLKLKMFGRLTCTNHPFLKIVKDRLNRSFFEPRCGISIEEPTNFAMEILREERLKLWENRALGTSADFMGEIRATNIFDVLNSNGRNSLAYFMLVRNRKRRIGQLSMDDLRTIIRFIDRSKRAMIELAVSLNLGMRTSIWDTVFIGGRFKKIQLCSTQELRQNSNSLLITQFKIGLTLEENVCKSWLLKISKLSSVRHREIILRILHGDVYTQERIARFGLSDNVGCPRCDLVEDLDHKFFDCNYVKRIWNSVDSIFGTNPNLDRKESNLGVHSDPIQLCVRAEILKRIMYLPKEPTYLLHPKYFTKLALKHIANREHHKDHREKLGELLNRLEQPQI
jgi:hypothetical protein